METQPLPITDPQPGQVVSGCVAGYCHGPHGENCLVVASAGVHRAYRVDPVVRLNPGTTVELRTVLLEKQNAPAWEVFARQGLAGLQSVPGQHRLPRTLLAEEWLKEIQTQILPDLVSQAERLRTDRSAQLAARHAINPTDHPELPYVTALASARKELLGREYVQVCRVAQAAAHRSAKAAAALRRHHLLRESAKASGPAPWGWIMRWRKSRRLRQHLKRAQALRQRTEAQRRRLERAADTPDTIERIERRAHELLKTDRSYRQQLAVLERQEQRASMMLTEAQRLVQYLQQRLGSSVTLQETTVKGRAHSVPTIPTEVKLPPNAPTEKAGVVPSLTEAAHSANNSPSPDHAPTRAAQAIAAQPTRPVPSVSNSQSKSNGIRMKL